MDNSIRARNLGFQTEATAKMLRDTYTLLATTMVPTALGAMLSFNFGLDKFFRSGMLGFILTMVIMFGLTWMIEKNKESKIGLGLLYLFTFFLGILLSGSIARVLSFSNGGELIAVASIGTMMIFGSCSLLSSIFKVDLAVWGKVLLVSGIAVIVALIATVLLKLTFLVVAVLLAVLVISSAFLFYEFSLIKQGYQTSAVSATLAIYLSLYNIFTSLLQILGIVGGDD